MYGLRNLNELAADDAAIEQAIDQDGGDATRFALHQYAAAWDDDVETMEQAHDMRMLALPRWFLPVVVALLCIIALAWGA